MPKLENALPEPKQCDVCCSLNIRFVNNIVIYGKSYGEWPYAWRCDDCRAAVSCHSGTRFPLGRMADRATRQLRTKAHEEFDRLWKSGLMTRDKAYQWLALELGIEYSHCHLSQLSKDQLRDVATLSADYLRTNYKALIRRKEKQDERRNESIKREERYDFRASSEAKRNRLERARRSLKSGRSRKSRR